MATNMSMGELTTAVAQLIDPYKAVKDDLTLGATFIDAGDKLDLVRDTLVIFPEQPTITPQARLLIESSQIQSSTQTVQAQLTPETRPTAENLLKGCHESTKFLRALFEKVLPREVSKARVQLYRDFLRDNGSDKLVETLVLKLMQNICLLAPYYGIEEQKLHQLRVAIDELKSKSSSDPNVDTPGNHWYTNSGSGTQFNASPGSTQNNSTGNGNNFPGANFAGAVSFHKD
ncbi:hypothetical protein V8C40DRAFT_244448 [Trichoderma camerunense]